MPTSLTASTAVFAILLSACGSDPGDPSARTHAGACADVAEEIGDLVVVVADHAANSEAGLAPAPVGAPGGVGAWDLMGRLADGSPDLEGRVAAAHDDYERRSCPPDAIQETVEMRVGEELSDRAEDLRGQDLELEEYAAVTLMSLISARFRARPSGHDVPEGVPAEFPVHPGAADGESDVEEDGSVTATWRVAGEDYEAVADYYLDALQEGRPGGWDVPRSEGSGTVAAEGQAVSGRQVLQIRGYGYAGEIEIASRDGGQVIVTARLAPQD